MSYSSGSRYSRSPSPYKQYRRSVSRSVSKGRSRYRSRSRSVSKDVENPGNNLYVTGLSTRITKEDLGKHFSKEGEVVDVHLVTDPWTRESRGFGFVTMSTLEDANRCIKYLDRSVLEGRVITVEKAKRRRGRTPTPGRYLGLRTVRVRRRSPSYSPRRRDSYSSRRSPSYSRGSDSYSPRRSPSYSPYRRRYNRSRSKSRSYSPYRRRYNRSRSKSRSYSSCSYRTSYSPDYYHRSYSPDYFRRSYPPDYYHRSFSPYGCRRSYSPDYRRRRSYSRSQSPYSRSPVRRCEQAYSYDSRDYSPDDRYHRMGRYQRAVSGRSYSRSISPRSRNRLRRSYSHGVSASPRRGSRRSYSCSVSSSPKRTSKRSCTGHGSSKLEHPSDTYSKGHPKSPSVRASSRSVSRSGTPRSSPSS